MSLKNQPDGRSANVWALIGLALITLLPFLPVTDALAQGPEVSPDEVVVELHTACDGEERTNILCRFYDGEQLLVELYSPIIYSFTQRITRITCCGVFDTREGEKLYAERVVDYQLGNRYFLVVDIPVPEVVKSNETVPSLN